MIIGIDGFSFQEKPSGIGKYFLSLVETLVDYYPSSNFICYSNKPVFLPKELQERIVIRRDESILKKLNPTIWLKFAGGHFIKKDKLDFYISCAGIFPNLERRTKKIALVHDLNYKIVPKTMGRLHLLSNILFLKKDVLHADFIITNSLGTSDKIYQYFGKKPNAIINPPTSPIFKKLEVEEVQRVLKKYNINYPYFLTVGTLEPRKNLAFTLKTFQELFNLSLNKEHKLVVVGGGGWKNKEILKLCHKYQSNITRLGYVKEDDLPALYSGARAFLFPSIYEGFGMPVREAVHCGCLVITSDLVELRESSYGSAIFIHPEKKSEMLQAIQNVLNDYHKLPFVEYPTNEDGMKSFIEFFKCGCSVI